MPHTRRARELGLSRVVIGPWDKVNERFKLRLCWGEQCIALCLGDNGMTEIRISLIYIALEDCGDGRIQLKMVPRFPRKFFGHTVNNHNSLREIRQDPSGGVLDTQCTAICFVRGGDPVKLAKDFVVRVEKFRVEIDKPEPAPESLLRELSVPSTPNPPLGPRNTNAPVWRKPVINGITVNGNSPMGNFGVTNLKPNGQFSRGVTTTNSVQTPRNDRARNSAQSRELPVGQVINTSLRYQRGEESAQGPRPRLYAPPPTPTESEGQTEQSQRAQLKVDQILPTLIRKSSKDRAPLRQENNSIRNTNQMTDGRRESPNPMMAALLHGSIPELQTYQAGIVPAQGRGDQNPLTRMTNIPREFHPPPPIFPSPTREYRPHRVTLYSTPRSTMSSLMSFTPSPGTSSMDTSIGTSDPSPPRTPYWEYKEGMTPSWTAQKASQPNITPNGVGLVDVITKPNPNTTSDMPSRCVVLRHKNEQTPGGAVSLRPAPVKSSLAEISVLAAYYWTIPLEELKLYGYFQGEKVALEHERDWQGYYTVCSSGGDKIVIDVHREKMGGINRCSSEIDCRNIWGPLSSIHISPPRGGPSNLFTSSGSALAGSGNLSRSSDPFSTKTPTYFVPKPSGNIGGTSDNGGALHNNNQNHT